ncbi:MAG: hypothetical protein ABIJ48_00965 [Actinomycetota bacterium]
MGIPLTEDCAGCDDLKAVSERRLVVRIGAISPAAAAAAIERVLRYLLDL